MYKRIGFLMVILLLLLNVGAVFANGTSQQETAGYYLKDIGLYKGYDDGTLGLERPITRAEFATLIVRILGEEEASKTPVNTNFKDVGKQHWASGYINTAVKHKLVQGYSDQTFRPEGKITYAEALTMLIRLLGYESQAKGEWPQSHIAVADSLGITKGLNYDANHVVNRGDIAVFIYQAMGLELK